MQHCLDGQQAFLDLFDAIEAGDLVTAAIYHQRIADAFNNINEPLRIMAAQAIIAGEMRFPR